MQAFASTGAAQRRSEAASLMNTDRAPKPEAASTEQTSRLVFVFRVYGVLALQNLAVLVAALCAYFIPGARAGIASNLWVVIAASVAFAGVAVPLFLFRSLGAVQAQPWSTVSFCAFVLVEMLLVGAVVGTFGTLTLVFFFSMAALALGSSAVFAMQRRFDFTVLLGVGLTSLCGLIFAGTISAVIGVPLGGFVWGALAAIIYCAVVVVHCEFTMAAIKDAKAFEPAHTALAKVDPFAVGIKVNLDLLVVFPFLMGVLRLMRECCGGSQPAKKGT